MGKNKVSEKGFYPVIVEVLEITNNLTATIIFGRMWSYSRMSKRRVCFATLEAIAKDLHITSKTVQRATSILESFGLIKDTTPTLRNRPHTYQIADLFELDVVMSRVDKEAEKAFEDEEERVIEENGIVVDEELTSRFEKGNFAVKKNNGLRPSREIEEEDLNQ